MPLSPPYRPSRIVPDLADVYAAEVSSSVLVGDPR
jgi:hypothetical protein